MKLMEHQRDVIKQLGSGKILYGVVGSGKSAAVLAYYLEKEAPRDIYVITTARKRDSLDWEAEAAKFGIGIEVSCYGRLHVDSWNNISKYEDVTSEFFIFDEQRVVGHGAWVKSFLKITKSNTWVLLSATPGDVWLDYVPVFIANGFFKNITEFKREHVKYKPFVKYPVIDRYLGEAKLERLRNDILVEMKYDVENKRVLNRWPVSYDKNIYDTVWKKRWNPYEDRPIVDAAELFRLMRRVVNSDESRLEEIKQIHRIHPRLIVFYNFNYELDILRDLIFEFTANVYEWNGHVKDKLELFEELESWIYLVQYVAGAEAWNCTSTNAMVLYSLPYSYKLFEQAQGRIDRMNTKFETLYYYIFVSDASIDRKIKAALERKESFNEKQAIREMMKEIEKSTDELELKYRIDEEYLEGCLI